MDGSTPVGAEAAIAVPAEALPEDKITAVGKAMSVAQRRLLFVVVLFGGLAATMVYGAVSPILPQLADHFGGGETGKVTAQLGMSMPAIGIMLGGLASGFLVSRVGFRGLMLGAIVGFGVLGVAGGLFADVWSFSATRLLLGVAGACWTTACVGLLAEIYGEKQRMTMIGFWKSSMALSAGFIYFASGWLGKAYGWQSAFGLYVALAVPALLLAVFVTPSIKPTPEPAQAGKAVGGWRGLIWNYWGVIRSAWLILIMIFFLHVMMMMGNNQIPFVLHAQGLKTSEQIGKAMFLIGPLGGIAAMASGYLQVRFGQMPVLVAAILAAAFGSIGIGLSPNVITTGVCAALMGVGTGIYLPIYMTLPLSRVTAAQRGTAIGLVQFCMYFGAFMNPIIMKPFDEHFSPQGTYQTIGITAVVAVVVVLVLGAVVRKRAAHGERFT
jgi:MFS family permease